MGFIFAFSACFVWGLIFVIPEMLFDFSGLEIVLGRYVSYGIFSLMLLFRKGHFSFPKGVWGFAFLCALLSNIFYYLGLIAGIRYATAPLAVLLVGLAPIVIAFYGNWKERSVSFKKLILPALWVLLGIALINFGEIDWSFSGASLKGYLLGLSGIIVALLGWSLYTVHNGRFLKNHPEIKPGEWSALIGVATLILSLVLLCGYYLPTAGAARIGELPLKFFVGTGVLGILCSWVGCALWNKASTYLPSAVMGLLLSFETLFGLLFVFCWHQKAPNILEGVGVLLLLSGVVMSIWYFQRSAKDKAPRS